MRALRLAAFELRRFRGRLPLAALAFACLVPTLYGAVYLWANWDPYGRLDRVPVAVVNQDRPVTVGGRRVYAGGQLVRQLKARRLFGWRFTDAADARDGLRDGRYYFIVTVPRDFSRKLTSPVTGSPERAMLLIRLDDANNFLVSIMAKTVRTEIQKELNAAAYASYADTALRGFAKLHKGLTDASTAASRLASGASDLHAGAKRLDGGIARLTSGAKRLEAGSAQVADGTGKLQAVVDTADQALSRALDQLRQLGKVGDDLRQQIGALVSSNPQLANDPDFQKLLHTIQGADSQLSAIGGAKPSRLGELRRSVDRLATGANRVAKGNAALHAGLDDAALGSAKLLAGSQRLASGTRELAARLAEARDQIPAAGPEGRSRQADVIANPVAIDSSNAHPARIYGRGLAPFFLSIALWVFGIVGYLLLRPVHGEALASRLPAWTVALGAWLPAALLGCVGALVLYAVVDGALGLDPESPPRTIEMMLLTVAAFVAVIHFLRAQFGAAGDALALALLVLQLAGSAGIYPIETAPGFLEAIHPFLPMTYSIDAFRITTVGGQGEFLLRDALLLGGLLVAALALSTWTMSRQRVWTLERLKPSVRL